jgi:cob(I)alamin adenosyltransferase
VKIYTKTGDYGETSLFSGGRVSKDNARIHSYGTVDELNAVLGLALALGTQADLSERIRRVQNELFALGADLATPLDSRSVSIPRIAAELVHQLEVEIDQFTGELPPLKSFIVPGGSPAAAALHQARTICRRAERWMVTIKEDINPEALIYINRLSDWLFTVARVANAQSGIEDPTWSGK